MTYIATPHHKNISYGFHGVHLKFLKINPKRKIKYPKLYGIWRNWQISNFCENKNGYVLGENFNRP